MSPVSPQGWQSHTVLLWAFPCHSALHSHAPSAPHRHEIPHRHTAITPHPVLPPPNSLCSQHRAHTAPKPSPHTPRAHNTQHTLHHQHPTHPMKGTLHIQSQSLEVFLLPYCPVPPFVLPDAELLESPSD